MKRYRVNLVFRKPKPEYHSIERVFDSLIPDLNNRIKIKKIYLPYSGGSPIVVFKNLIKLKIRKSEINHITGDIHYMSLVTGNRSLLTIHDVKSAFSSSLFKNFYIRLFWFWLPSFFVYRITVISEFTRKELGNLIPWAKNKIVVIPNPVGKKFKYVPKTFNLVNPNILLIGTKSNKNLERSLLALKELTCTVTIIGQLSQRQRQLLRDYNIDYVNKFNITDEQMLKTYQEADIICFPSTYEGFGMPIIEAQAIGRPVLTSDIEPMKSVSGNGACLVDPFNFDRILSGLRNIIGDNEYRSQLISDGLENAQKFNHTHIVKEYIRVYESIAKI